MVSFTWNSRKGKTVPLTAHQWLPKPGWWWGGLQRGMKEFFQVIGMFCVFIVAMVVQVYNQNLIKLHTHKMSAFYYMESNNSQGVLSNTGKVKWNFMDWTPVWGFCSELAFFHSKAIQIVDTPYVSDQVIRDDNSDK